MKKLFLLTIAAMFVASVASGADCTATYSWEDGGTIIGSYGNLVDPFNVSGPQDGLDGSGVTYTCPGAYDGLSYLHVAEDPHYSTPQAYLCWITGLADGDQIHVELYVYDETPSLSPTGRAWGHYTDSVDPLSYSGSPGIGSDYSAGLGWDMVEYDLVYDTELGDHDGWMVEGRIYSYPSTGEAHTDIWFDYLTVSITSPTWCGTIQFPCDFNPVEPASWSAIKAMYR